MAVEMSYDIVCTVLINNNKKISSQDALISCGVFLVVLFLVKKEELILQTGLCGTRPDQLEAEAAASRFPLKKTLNAPIKP